MGVIGANLRRLRTAAELNQTQLAERAGLSITAYRKLEKARSQPRSSTLRNLAAALGVGLQELLTPVKQLRRVRFRSLKRMKRREHVLAQVSRWLRSFADLQQLLGEPTESELKALAKKLRHRPKGDVPRVAAAAREHFDLAPEEPVHDVCGLLEAHGIKVFSVNVASDAFLGLSVDEPDLGQAVVVNVYERLPVERWIFSAAHELGHLLLHLGAFDVVQQDEDRYEEKQADVFASHFLMPEEVFNREWRYTRGLPLLERIFKVKRIFRVSWRTVLYRVSEQLPKASRDRIWKRLHLEYKHRYGKPLLKHDEPHGGDGTWYRSLMRQPQDFREPAQLDAIDFRSERLFSLVRRAIETDAISLGRGAEILGLSLRQMRELSASWAAAAEVG